MAGVAARRRAFTLTELMVAISIIALASAIVLPSASKLFTASADDQARAVLSATLGAVRAAAIERGEHTAVHVQIHAEEEVCRVAALIGEVQTDGSVLFKPLAEFQPRRLPGGIAFGEVSEDFVSSGGDYTNVDGDAGLADFTSFTVVFSPEGVIVNQPLGEPVRLEGNNLLFGASAQAVWSDLPASEEAGVRAVTYFNYADLKQASDRAEYLNDYGEFICLNPYTGQLMESD
jgi:prepilin-type N-terminal cleavage/methylation domain-containing protein